MELFTKIDIFPSEFKINHEKKLFFAGSCFAENISERFTARKFHTLVNPFGIIYNPISIANMVRNIANGKIYGAEDVFYGDGRWNCWDAHSSLSASTPDVCVSVLNNAIENAREYLRTADIAFITLGTAYVYFLKESGAVVSNCHRQDARLFERKLISVEEAANALHEAVSNLRSLNPKIHIVFTVSPLRHLSDGAHGNSLSKATLQLAVDKVMQNLASEASTRDSKNCGYFPSYEIVMDELRDYRFYDRDMVHLSTTAEDYIFERMCETYCSDTTIAHIKYVEKFMKGATHRIEDTSSPQTKDFARLQIERAENLEHTIDGLDLSEEKEYFGKFI